MILITPSQRDYVRIMWKSDKNDPVSTYRLNTVTYGTTSAPFLATRTLKQIAIDNREKFPIAAEILETDFYVDDLVSSVSNIETGKEIQKQIVELLSCAGMKLHINGHQIVKICCKNFHMKPRNIIMIETKKNVKPLGLIWNPKHDILQFSVNDPTNISKWTKRSILSHIARIFDPMGLLGLVIAKLFMKNLWLVKRNW
ncbi:integrase catalytic domain-containing protein [Trichonephila clavipes]|nr:integrase catalytic domain-containing protein [Trichonephila clavipes]